MRIILLILASVAAWGQTPFSTAVQDSVPYPFSPAWINSAGGVQTWANLNGSTIKAAQCGYLNTAGGATKTLQNLHVMVATANKTSGTDLRLGIQAPSTTTGPPIQPDGSWAASGAAYATVADSAITANTWLRSGTVGGTLSMTQGGLYCLVVEPENYAGSDSYLLRSVFSRSGWSAQSASYNGATWTGSNGGIALHLLEFTDGTFGTLGLGAPLNVVGTTVAFNTGSTDDEIGLKIIPDTPLVVTGICAENPYSTSTGDFEWVLYEGTTARRTVTTDVNTLFTTSATNTICGVFDSYFTLAVGSTYYAALKPTTSNNIRIVYNTVADANYWSVWSGGPITSYSARADGGAWTDTDTRRPSIWLLISAAGSAGGSGGGAYVVAQ
jgi:hypothetical protein